ncbi:MAG: UDP-N-acetylmuramate--L-alanine ligase [Deltaproteobacteria bacterium]|nr:UDP-N-acetylmuramate--L-alanine ligase [Deltaproteobacteria bacterium]
MFRGRIQKIHFVGIGGIGMSGIAEVLLAHGFQISGSDLRQSEITRRLAAMGVRIQVEHRAENVRDAHVVVFSSAIDRNNPELVEARGRAIPVIGRAEMLAELMRLKDGIAISGSHGKTTTTSLVATILRAADLDPTVIIGGKLNLLGSNATRGRGSLLVAEADESDGSFLCLTPVIAVITNIDPEHLDYFRNIDAIKDSFVAFANRVPFYGLVVACIDHPRVQEILPRIEKRTVTYGLTELCDYRARNPEVEGLSTRFELIRRGVSVGGYRVNMPGIHNVNNSLAAIAVADELGIELEIANRALRTFEGVQRRFSVIGEHRGIIVVDDYGHHPAEIQATLEAAQRAYARRLVVAFQPHRFSRTHHLFEQLACAFNRAEVVVITDVYAAGEKPIEGANSERLARAMREQGHRDVTYVPERSQVAAELLKRVQPGDVVITIGAGSITQTAPEFLRALQSSAGEDA